MKSLFLVWCWQRFVSAGEVFVIDEPGDYEYEADVGGGHDWLSKHHGYEEKRQEWGEVAHLVDERRIAGHSYRHSEADERDAHLKRPDIDSWPDCFRREMRQGIENGADWEIDHAEKESEE